MKKVLYFISFDIGTDKNIVPTIQQNIIVVPRSGCKNISIAINKHIPIGKRLFAQLFSFF